MEISYQLCLSSLKVEAEPYFVQKLEGRWLYFRTKADYIQLQKEKRHQCGPSGLRLPMSLGLRWVGHCRHGDTDCPTQAFAHMAIRVQRQVALRMAVTPGWFSGGGRLTRWVMLYSFSVHLCFHQLALHPGSQIPGGYQIVLLPGYTCFYLNCAVNFGVH